MYRLPILFLLLFTCQTLSAKDVGHSVFARGVVTAQSEQGQIRVLGKNAPLYERDVITTGKKSFVVLKLLDGTRMTLRPETVFKIEEFEHQEKEKENAVLRLFKGGLRAITGFISKKSPNAYRLKTSVATIGIRGTEFDARLCEDDCQQEAGKFSAGKAEVRPPVVARIAFLRGELSSRDVHDRVHDMSVGAPVYEGDLLSTAARSFAVLAFRDKSRITLKAETDFKVEKMQFNQEKPAEGSAIFRLFKGGLRALSGLIGKSNPRAVKYSTPVATIGIRGTGFDLQCQGSCVEQTSASSNVFQPALDILQQLLEKFIPDVLADGLPQGDGMFASVWSGAIVFELAGGDLFLNEGKALFLPHQSSTPILLAEIPVFLSRDPAPRPDKVDIDHRNLFDASAEPQSEPGLYLSLYDGHLSVDDGDEVKDIGAGEAIYVNKVKGPMLRMEIIPPFQSNDPYLKMINKDFENVFDILGETNGEFECVIQ